MSWKNVQYENGKMRTSEGGGGGGSSTFAGLDDVNFSNLQNGQVPKYNSTTQKWENADESGSEWHEYSTDEKVVGKWIDGKPIYEKTIHIDSISSTSFTVNHGISNLKEIVSLDGSIRGTMSNAYYYEPLNDHAGMNSGYSTRVADINQTIISVQVGSGRASTATDANITIRYTKTTD